VGALLGLAEFGEVSRCSPNGGPALQDGTASPNPIAGRFWGFHLIGGGWVLALFLLLGATITGLIRRRAT
jgi:hypothetical protein